MKAFIAQQRQRIQYSYAQASCEALEEAFLPVRRTREGRDVYGSTAGLFTMRLLYLSSHRTKAFDG